MNRGKMVVGLLFGGRSAEHEISVRSAATVFAAFDRARFEPVLLGIARSGTWHVLEPSTFERLTQERLPAVPEVSRPCAFVPGREPARLYDLDRGAPATPPIDAVFPVLHGSYGEDGAVQGLLELLGVPYVGADVLGSALGMDKDVQKRLLREAGLPVVPFATCHEWEWRADARSVLERAQALPLPLFVKPARLGSSVGVSKVEAVSELGAAIEAALAYDSKVVIEKGLEAREIECSVLGGSEVRASVPGEIRARGGFYSYAAKYLDPAGAELIAPAELDRETAEHVRNLAVQAFRTLQCYGMARVDFFLERKTGALFVNEINTIPGFTSISMYPRLWELSGLALPELVSALIELALARHELRRGKKLWPEVAA